MSGPMPAVRDRYHELEVIKLIRETEDAVSVVFAIPPSLADAYEYSPGQFVTMRLELDGDTLYRSYSMSSAPSLDDDLRVTVKRVEGGIVSNWINDRLSEGDKLEVSLPTGSFVLAEGERDVVAFAGGSGITPVYSIVRTVLADTDRNVRLLFANAERSAAIFGTELDDLAARHPGRFELRHHEDAATGFLEPGAAADFARGTEAEVYICGPAGYMDVVTEGLEKASVDPGLIHIERFTPPSSADGAGAEPAETATDIGVTITYRGRTETVSQRGNATILQSARWAGIQAPSTCEAGHCATCMAEVIEGDAEMRVNDALSPDEVAEGLVLTCQAVPRSDIRVNYDL
jgi:3-ketosteroid 9alpha-monooxygenase subunit B